MAQYWADAANAQDTSPGARAYAFQQSDMYSSIAARCKIAFNNVRRTGTGEEQLDHSLVKRSAFIVSRAELTLPLQPLKPSLLEIVPNIEPYQPLFELLQDGYCEGVAVEQRAAMNPEYVTLL